MNPLSLQGKSAKVTLYLLTCLSLVLSCWPASFLLLSLRGKLVGVTIGHSGIRIPFLTFADDTMIFAKASDVSCSLIKDILDKYFSQSGQLVNFHKSSFQVTSNISDHAKRNFASILGMVETHDLGDYLGCPIISSRVTKETFAKLTTKVGQQLPKWKANSLSQAGQTILIQSNLATKANYQMQSFILPKCIVISFGIRIVLMALRI